MTDLIGHDTLRDISNALYPELATDRTASTTIEQHVADGRLGVKSGRGFYDDNENESLSSRASSIESPVSSTAIPRDTTGRSELVNAGGTPAQPTIPFTTRSTGRPCSISHCTPQGSIQ